MTPPVCVSALPCKDLVTVHAARRYNPDERLSADAALHDPYFFTEPLPARPDEIAALVRHAAQETAAEAALYSAKRPQVRQQQRRELASG